MRARREVTLPIKSNDIHSRMEKYFPSKTFMKERQNSQHTWSKLYQEICNSNQQRHCMTLEMVGKEAVPLVLFEAVNFCTF